MKQIRFFILIFCSLNHNIHSKIATQTYNRPDFAEPIHLFQKRNLGKLILDKAQTLYERVLGYMLSTNKARDLVHQASQDPTKREIGHQEHRKEIYTGQLVQPNYIVLLSSDKATLQETTESLQRHKLAHNFIIDRNGNVHPITNENESVEDALMHRPFAVGISAATCDGFTQDRDMNSHSITISLVGLDTESHTTEQANSLSNLVGWLSQLYTINPHNVRVYGAVAYPYHMNQDPEHGRRKITTHDFLQKLAQQGLALWPQAQHNTQNLQTFLKQASKKEIVHWMSGALRKLGFLCPDTEYSEHLHFLVALNKFQQLYHCDQQYRDQLIQLIKTKIDVNNIATLETDAQQMDTVTFVTHNHESLIALNSLLQQAEECNNKLKLVWPPPKL